MSGWVRLGLVAWALWTWWSYAYIDNEWDWYDESAPFVFVAMSLGPPIVGAWIWRGFKPKAKP